LDGDFSHLLGAGNKISASPGFPKWNCGEGGFAGGGGKGRAPTRLRGPISFFRKTPPGRGSRGGGGGVGPTGGIKVFRNRGSLGPRSGGGFVKGCLKHPKASDKSAKPQNHGGVGQIFGAGSRFFRDPRPRPPPGGGPGSRNVFWPDLKQGGTNGGMRGVLVGGGTKTVHGGVRGAPGPSRNQGALLSQAPGGWGKKTGGRTKKKKKPRRPKP